MPTLLQKSTGKRIRITPMEQQLVESGQVQSIDQILNLRSKGGPPSLIKTQQNERPGFFGTLGTEVSGGLQDLLSGGAELVGLGQERSPTGLRGPGSAGAFGKAALGALRTFPGAPIEALAELGGEKVQDLGELIPGVNTPITAEVVPYIRAANPLIGGLLPEGGGVSLSDIFAGLTKAGLQMFSPTQIAKLGVKSVNKLLNILPKKISTRTELRKVSQSLSPRRTNIEEAGEIVREGLRPPAITETPVGAPIFEDFVKSSAAGISPTTVTKTRIGTEVTQRTLPQASRIARRGPSRKYRQAERIGGDELFPQTNTEQTVANIVGESREVQGVLPTEAERLARTLKAGGSAAERSEDALRVPLGPSELGTGVLIPDRGLRVRDIAELRNLQARGVRGLPEDLIQEFGLGETGRQRTVRAMIKLRQRIRNRARQAERLQDDNAARQLRKIEGGITLDLKSQAVAERTPEAIRLLNEADAAFAQNVAPFFTKGKFARKLSDTDAEKVVDTLFKNNNVSEIRNVKGAIAQLPGSPQERVDEFRKLSRAWYDDLIEQAKNPVTNEFDQRAFVKQWQSYTDDVKREILGVRSFNEVDSKIKLMQRANIKPDISAKVRPPTLTELLSKRISNKEASTIVDTAIQSENLSEIRAIKKALPEDQWQTIQRAWFDHLIDNSFDPRVGSFDNVRFATGFNKFAPPVQKEMLGTNLDKVRNIIDRIQSLERQVGAVGQPTPFLTRIGILKVGGNIMAGNPLGAIQSGVVWLTPYALSRVLTNRRAVILINKGLKVGANTESAAKIGAQLAEVLNVINREQDED